MSAPTKGEVAKARATATRLAEQLIATGEAGPIVAAHAVRTILAALDAAERERERDVARAILWCDDSLSGYVETQAETEADLSARAAKAERMERERDEAVRSLSDFSRRSTDDIEFLRTRAETAEARVAELERERDEARALAVPPGAIVVRDDAETREAMARAIHRSTPTKLVIGGAAIDCADAEAADEMARRIVDGFFDALREVSRG